MIYLCPHSLSIQRFFFNIVSVGYNVFLYDKRFILRGFPWVEEVTADKGRINIIFIGFTVLIWTMEDSMFLFFGDLLVDVNTSPRGTLRTLNVSGTYRSIHV
jgi:hypothetical protein